MPRSVEVVRSSDDADLWRVAVDGRNLVGFYGPKARVLAERHRDELAELLGTSNGEAQPEGIAREESK